jgi:uncharacterized PurR-regulated membrane protein YhhQ (DUF165 family)
MSFQDAFLRLQEPATSLTICALAVIMAAVLLKKPRTALTLSAIMIVLHVIWAAAPLPETPLVFGISGAVLVYILLLAAFFAVAMQENAWAVIYIALMPIINWSFAAVQTFPIPDALGGGLFQPLAIVTGLVLVVRDFAQREIKHWIWGAMIVGLALSSLTSWIQVVVASGVAFLISETVDWAVYTFSKRPLSQRIMISSLASAPLDQIVFIGLASLVVPGIFAWGTVITGIASKLLGAWIVSQIVARQEQRSAKSEMNPA